MTERAQDKVRADHEVLHPHRRFPRSRRELAAEAVEFVARQVGVPAAEFERDPYVKL